jgi:hypothetical protein
MDERTIDGHINNTRLANGEEAMPNYVFEIGSPTIECASLSNPNERRPSRNDVRLNIRGA